MPYQLPPPKNKSRWVERWSVESDDLNREYVVSRDAQGEYGCSCPQWKFMKAPKEPCKHIELLQIWLRRGGTPSTPRNVAPGTGTSPEQPGRSLLRRKRGESGS